MIYNTNKLNQTNKLNKNWKENILIKYVYYRKKYRNKKKLLINKILNLKMKFMNKIVY